jgi:hypothetical protein
MSKILVSGLAIGSNPNINTCQVCNYDLSWLFKNPSTLLWAEKIIVTPEIIKHIKESSYPGGSDDLGKAINLIFEYLELHGLLEVKDVSNYITSEVTQKIYSQIDNDIMLLKQSNVKNIKDGDVNVPGHFYLNDFDYCTPSLWTKYASLFLAKELKANIYFTDNSINYFDKILSLSEKKLNITNESHAFEDIFTAKIPEYELLPPILFDADLCTSCASIKDCESDVFAKIEENINNALTWRTYDEIHQIKDVLKKISNESKNIDISASEIKMAFAEEERNLRIKINSTFPKVQRWSNMVTILSIPVAVAGVSTSSVALGTIGSATAGISMAIDKYLEIVKNKNRWVGYKIQ